jgi:hypothetical protein
MIHCNLACSKIIYCNCACNKMIHCNYAWNKIIYCNYACNEIIYCNYACNKNIYCNCAYSRMTLNGALSETLRLSTAKLLRFDRIENTEKSVVCKSLCM